MKYLTVDFGSTYTKLTAIDAVSRCVVGTSIAFTTIETDVMEGFRNAQERLGEFPYDELICCSSAAGGLKMVALGLVPELTAKAARMAATSAGAKVVKTYSYEISKAEQVQIDAINPDLVLLCGGTDGGNKEVIIANARRLATSTCNFSIIVAGNKSAADDINEILTSSGKNFVITDNVMPTFNVLNTTPAKECIKDLFIQKIVDAKGLSQVQSMTRHSIIPTPLAVLLGCELLSRGTQTSEGIGEIMAVDLGGATTDIYSMATGEATGLHVIPKGLPEPYNKRTVEGDLGMRYSLDSLVSQSHFETMSPEIQAWAEQCIANPETLATNENQQAIETMLAHSAVELAVERHCGVLEKVYTPLGEIYTLEGKDLTSTPCVIGIGGAIINSPDPRAILEGARYDSRKIGSMRPRNPKYMLDKRYIFASMGLLSSIYPELALEIMKNEIKFL